jgi:hypothetical protein
MDRSLPTPTFPFTRQRRLEMGRNPMPTGGLNFQATPMQMGPDDCYVCENLIPRGNGLEIRKGWRYWVPQANKFAGEVRTIMSFMAQDSVDSKLFAGVGEGGGKIYDITTIGVAPTVVLTPTSPALTAGEFYWTNFVNAFQSILCVVAAGSGYFTYDKTNGWKEILVGSGADGNTVKFPAGDISTTRDLAFCWMWKNRLWFIKTRTAQCYYLPVGQSTGVLSMFDFGPQLIRGGPLAFASNWTYDSGQGIDDSLVLVSANGDVLLYKGTDPATATTFALSGVWFIGRVPAGRRGYCQYGGDVLMTTEYGVVRLSDLISGKLHTAEIIGSIATKVNPLIARAVTDTVMQTYWFLLPVPAEELVLLGTPYRSPGTGILQQFLMNSMSSAWASAAGLDPLCAARHSGNVVAGKADGSVVQLFFGSKDGDTTAGVGAGNDIVGRLVGAFSDYGTPNNNKRMLRTKIYGLADGNPSLVARFMPEYRFNELLNVYSALPIANSTWDLALWDNVLWSSGSVSFHKWLGTSAFGKKLALQLSVIGTGSTLLTDFEAAFEIGIGL